MERGLKLCVITLLISQIFRVQREIIFFLKIILYFKWCLEEWKEQIINYVYNDLILILIHFDINV